MLTNFTTVRVIYADTDNMKYAYYGNYAKYYEIGRTEAIRSLGISYREMEEQGVFMPVHSMSSRFLKPAFYDELLTIKTIVEHLPEARIVFKHEIFNIKDELIHTAEVTLFFLDAARNRPVRAPELFLELIRPFYEDQNFKSQIPNPKIQDPRKN
jgi:acyl-CoA thioester hydrolase